MHAQVVSDRAAVCAHAKRNTSTAQEGSEAEPCLKEYSARPMLTYTVPKATAGWGVALC